VSLDLVNRALSTVRLALKPRIGLVLTGSIDQVRICAARTKLLPIRGVEIISYNEPGDPNCAFLASMHALRYLRVFAGPLTNIEAIQSLKRLQALRIEHVGKRQSISLSFDEFPVLNSVVLEWFRGAEDVFKASPLRSISLMYFPMKTSEALLRLSNLVRIRLSSCRTLVWIALHDLKNPGGYGVYMNRSGQTVNPFTGRTIPLNNPWAHILR